jgi:hypothetical protein
MALLVLSPLHENPDLPPFSRARTSKAPQPGLQAKDTDVSGLFRDSQLRLHVRSPLRGVSVLSVFVSR